MRQSSVRWFFKQKLIFSETLNLIKKFLLYTLDPQLIRALELFPVSWRKR